MKPASRPYRAEMQLAQRRHETAPQGDSSSQTGASAPRGARGIRSHPASRINTGTTSSALGDSHYALLEDLKQSIELRLGEIALHLGLPQNQGGGQSADSSHVPVDAELVDSAHLVTEVIKDGGGGPKLDLLREDLRRVVGATERATYTILEATEHISRLSRALKAQIEDQGTRQLAEEILGQAVKVFEGCGFQDLTGQRVNRVIARLNEVEARILELDGLLPQRAESAAKEAAAAAANLQSDGSTADGPAQPYDTAQRVTQEDIDRLFD